MVCNAVITAETGKLTAAGKARVAFNQVVFTVVVKKKFKIDAADDTERDRKTAAAILKLLIVIHVHACPTAVDGADKFTPDDCDGITACALTDDISNYACAFYKRLNYVQIPIGRGDKTVPLVDIVDVMQTEAAAPVVRFAYDRERSYGLRHIAEKSCGYGGQIRAIFIDELGKALFVAADIQGVLRGDAQTDTVLLKPAAVMIKHINFNVNKRKNI